MDVASSFTRFNQGFQVRRLLVPHILVGMEGLYADLNEGVSARENRSVFGNNV